MRIILDPKYFGHFHQYLRHNFAARYELTVDGAQQCLMELTVTPIVNDERLAREIDIAAIAFQAGVKAAEAIYNPP